jgi:superfamily II DNA helicase RecQ
MGSRFRPDYKNLGILKIHFPSVPMMALTVSKVKHAKNIHFLEVNCA